MPDQPSRPRRNHDIIAIGASFGGVEALQRVAHDLPADLPAAVFVVLHVGRARSELAGILDRAGPLRATEAVSGEPICRGLIYVARPDHHLLVHDRHVLVRRGPHENMSRPAIDPLFRSAACSHGAGVIGVVLSGALNDGTAGLAAIKRCGGLAVIQDPADAVLAEMRKARRATSPSTRASRSRRWAACSPSLRLRPLVCRARVRPIFVSRRRSRPRSSKT